MQKLHMQGVMETWASGLLYQHRGAAPSISLHSVYCTPCFFVMMGFFFFFLPVPEIEPGASHRLGKHYSNRAPRQTFFSYVPY